MTTSLAGQTAVVTGSGSGIGRAIAISLATHGANVCLVGRTETKLRGTSDLIPDTFPKALVLPTDLTVDEQMDRLYENIRGAFGGISILVLSAGEISHGALREASIKEYDTLYRANVRAPYRLIQLFLPLLKVSEGQIVVINSSAGLTASANAGQFSSTQHAMKAVADSLRNEVNSEGIRVLSIYPGRTATPRQEMLYAKAGKEYHPELLLQPEDIAAVVLNALTLPRTAEVTDVSIRPFRKSY